MGTVLELSCKALSSLLPFDEGKLLKDLNDNFMVKRELEMIASLRYGKYMIIASAVLLTAKDVDFVKESASEDSSLVKPLIKFLSLLDRNLSKYLCKVLGRNLSKCLCKFLCKNFKTIFQNIKWMVKNSRLKKNQ